MEARKFHFVRGIQHTHAEANAFAVPIWIGVGVLTGGIAVGLLGHVLYAEIGLIVGSAIGATVGGALCMWLTASDIPESEIDDVPDSYTTRQYHGPHSDVPPPEIPLQVMNELDPQNEQIPREGWFHLDLPSKNLIVHRDPE